MPDLREAGGTAEIIDDRLRRWDVPLLADPELQAEVREEGFAVRPGLLDRDDVDALHDVGGALLEALGGTWGDLFLTVGRIEDTAVRSELIARAGRVVLPRLRPWFVPGTAFLASALQVKPPRPTSELNPHQDSSLVDEDRWPGLYAWSPLVDTDQTNGGLTVVPGSHRLRNPQRTLSVPWQLAGGEEVLRRHSIALDVAAGDVVFFDSATVHASPPNRSTEVRLAVTSFARPPGAPLMHFYRDEATPPGQVEAFEIEPSFLYSDDIMERPGRHHRALGLRPQHRLTWDEPALDRTCAALAGRQVRT